MGVKCAKCGSHNTAEYLYGMPAMNEKLEKDIAEHKIILGGCIVSELSPKFYCNECKKDFGYSAKRQCEGEIVDYIEDTNYFMFSIYYMDFGETKFVLSRQDGKYTVQYITSQESFTKEISEKEYKKNLTTIFEKAYLLEWDKEYIRLPDLDGTKWKIEIKCDSGKSFSSHGKSCFPPYFKKVKSRHDYYAIKFEHNNK